MLFGKFIAAFFGLLYLYFVVEAFSGHVRNGWFFKSVSPTNKLLYNFTVLHDLLAGLLFLWIALTQVSFLFGRTIMLWLAHLAISAVALGKFDSEDDEGNPTNYGCIARPVLLVLGLYWYYLAVLEGISMLDVFETIVDILDA
ncbi:MAG: hypothetical protein Kow0029_31430 [Candidatus Rifleibacteriota bacterium]